MSYDLTPEKRDELRVRAEVAKPFVGHDFVAPPFTTIDAADLRALLDAADERDRLLTVVPCSETRTEPFDFAYCSTHDTTFALADHCYYAGLSEFDYMEKQATEQRVRAIRAEDERDRLAAALRQIAEACHWSHDPSDDPEALSAYIGQLQRSADDALDAAAAVERVRALHRSVGIYDECDCSDDAKSEGHIDVYEVGTTCNKLYDICDECCRNGGYQTEDCANYHEHQLGETHLCPTISALDGTDDGPTP